ncbi:beta-galactoside-binding lectin-like [Clupea harengus]|uniref:Galectin n=1 Tax=Clupea harengus TaxID=7950 RepID=A0A8M1KIE0_CLUHA|nr:beta-galactoside-binding lectin-like [Clupea harengus]
MLTVKNWSFKTTQKLVVTGKAPGDDGFSINIGDNEDNIALHFNPRFNEGDSQTIVLNSKKNGSWGAWEEMKFPYIFSPHQEFEVTFNFNDQQFDIKLPNDNMMYFPNRFGVFKFKHMHFEGAVRIHSISIT